MRWLAHVGVLVLEMATDQTLAMSDRAWSAGFVEVCIHPDLTGRERSIVARVPA